MIDVSTYLVADLATIDDGDPAAIVAAAVEGGVTAVQIRGKHLADGDLLRVVDACAEAIAGRAVLLINDRVDVFLAARAAGMHVDGVHVGQGDEPVEDVRERVGPRAIVGLSASTGDEITRARTLSPGTVDYLGVGAVRATPTKPDAPEPLGWDGFARATQTAGALPCVAIGGVGVGDAADAIAAGAAGIAVVRAICRAADPEHAARELHHEWQRAAHPVPNVLTIAGSDPSGGAGIQADLKTIQATGGYGMAAIAALTIQNTQGVAGVHVPPAAFLGEQLAALDADVRIDAVKIGMLADATVIDVVADWLAARRESTPVVLDPVMIATSGHRLLDAAAEAALTRLVGLADVITPNLPELAVLVGEPEAREWPEALAQAQRLAARHEVLVYAKGGHLPGDRSPDALVGSAGVLAAFDGTRIDTASTHGTGCSLSSAIASIRAGDRTALADDVRWAWSARLAREWLRGAIAAADGLEVGSDGGHGPVDHAYALRAGIAPPRRDAELDAWWEDISELRAAIVSDSFVTQLADGSLDAARFAEYLRQDAIYLEAYAHLLARAAVVAPTRAERRFWEASAASCRETEMELHRAHGATEARTPSREAAAYLAHLERAAATGDHGVLVAALLPCFWRYDDIGRDLAAANRADHPYRDWLDTYGSDEFARDTRAAIAWVQQAARRAPGARLRLMRRAFVQSAEHERAFFAQGE